MSDLNRIRRTVAVWTERKIRRAHEAGLSAIEASLKIMDSLDKRFDFLSDGDLWISADYKEWCVYLKLVNGRKFFVNEQTLIRIALS